MTQYGATHRLLVEHENDGIEDVELYEGGTREAHVCRVLYYVEHPEDCLMPHERAARVREHEEYARRASINSETEHVDPTAGDYGCPVNGEIENVGLLDALGVTGGRKVNHLQEGTYALNAWYRHYSSPEGDDWDGGLEYELEDGSGGSVVLHEATKTTLTLQPDVPLADVMGGQDPWEATRKNMRL